MLDYYVIIVNIFVYKLYLVPNTPPPSLPFNTKSYLSSLPYHNKSFMKEFCNTQMFACFISDHVKDPPDPYLPILQHVIDINRDEGVKTRYKQSLSRRLWILNEFKVKGIDIDKVKDIADTEDLNRVIGTFPKFNYALFDTVECVRKEEGEDKVIRRARQVSGSIYNIFRFCIRFISNCYR